jgi:hypothetical protein
MELTVQSINWDSWQGKGNADQRKGEDEDLETHFDWLEYACV